MSIIHPFIMAGGVGSRLWPLSRESYPKQFLRLLGSHSLLQQTCKRLAQAPFAPFGVIGHEDHRFIIAEHLREAGFGQSQIIIEPVRRNTAATASTAALLSARHHGDDALMALCPADHAIADPDAYAEAMREGMPLALSGRIVVFGVRPTSPHTGYGYIELRNGEPPRFVEKPDTETAARYLASGTHLWNAGLVLCKANSLIAAFESLAPDILEACREALATASHDLDFLRLGGQAFARARSISLDYAVLEKSDALACVTLDAGWSDIGSWSAMRELADADSDGNVASGDVVFHGCANVFARSDGPHLSVLGLNDCFVVAAGDAVLVAANRCADEVGRVVERLACGGHAHAVSSTRTHRPWGWFDVLSGGDGYLVKSILVHPGGRLSLQSHRHRSEHWVVVSGRVEVTVGESVSTLSQNQSTYIPLGERHRLANPFSEPAMLIEVQSGGILSEDDIERHDDVYGRANDTV